MQNRVVFGSRANCNTRIMSCRTKDRRIVALGATTCKHNLADFATKHFGNVIARLVNCFAGYSRKPM
jgi:hypothetical protein